MNSPKKTFLALFGLDVVLLTVVFNIIRFSWGVGGAEHWILLPLLGPLAALIFAIYLIDGYRDLPWGWLIYDFFVARAEGDVHHASARQFRNLFAAAGLAEVTQKIHRGPAPFILTEAVAPPRPTILSPHFKRAATRIAG